MTSPPLTLTGHQSEVFAVAWSPDGAILASSARDRTIRLWKMPGGDPVATLTDHRGAVHDVAFAPIGGVLAETVLASASADQTVRVWESDGTPIKTLEGHGGQVRALAWSPDGTFLASAGTFWNFSEIKLWTMLDGAREADNYETLHTGKGALVFCVDASRGRAYDSPMRIAAGLAPGFVQVWHSDRQESARLRCHGEAVRALAFAPDGSMLATGSSDATLKLWASREVMHDPDLLHTLRGHTGAVRAVAFSLDGSCIASGGSDGAIRLWNATSGAAIAAFGDQAATIHGLAWSPDGSRIASAAADGIVHVWDVR